MKIKIFRSVVNTFVLLVVQFVCLLLLYMFLRIGFFLFNQSLFRNVDLNGLLIMCLGGVKFDIVALLYLNILYILLQSIPFPFKYNLTYQKLLQWIFVTTNAIGVLLNLADYVYYPFTLKRTTGTVIEQFSNESNVFNLIVEFFADFWYLIILLAIVGYLLIIIFRFFKIEKPQPFKWNFYVVQVVALLVVAFLFIGGVRGGWAHSTRPITLSNAGDYVNYPEEMAIVLNTPFSILKTLKAIHLQPLKYFDENKLSEIYPLVHTPKNAAPFKNLNVVILILESFGKEHIGALNRNINNGSYDGYTPFLDSLIQESYTFTRTYANGRKSIDALPSIMSGIPSMGEPFVLSIYSGNHMTSLPSILADKGYETAFFHGAPNGSMGFSAYTRLAGVQKYYGKNEYNNDQDFDGIWGIWDEPFLQFTAKEINQLKQPFFAGFFSLSSHHPFKVPEKYVGKFPKGPLEVQEPVGYTDLALKNFFASAKQTPWYKNTLFVLCADHATVSYLPEYKTAPNAFSIPIIFYYPGGDLKGLDDRLVQQIDILPTVLNYLNYDKPYVAFGFDAFDNKKENFVVNSTGDLYNLMYKNYYMTYDGKAATSLYDLHADPFLRNNELKTNARMLDTLQNKMHAFMQQYNNRMINNKLVMP